MVDGGLSSRTDLDLGVDEAAAMSNLPADRKYALRHGTTGRIWRVCQDGLWLFNSPQGIERAWKTAKKAGLVNSAFSDHTIIVIKLVESQIVFSSKTLDL